MRETWQTVQSILQLLERYQAGTWRSRGRNWDCEWTFSRQNRRFLVSWHRAHRSKSRQLARIKCFREIAHLCFENICLTELQSWEEPPGIARETNIQEKQHLGDLEADLTSRFLIACNQANLSSYSFVQWPSIAIAVVKPWFTLCCRFFYLSLVSSGK